MEKESFEDIEVAEALNKDFVSIKVDREERPDIDHIYMSVCQTLTGHGGWPMTILMTPDKKPFYAGTYFPKHDSSGLPGILTLLSKVSSLWKKDRKSLIQAGEDIVRAISHTHKTPQEINIEEIIHEAYSDYKYSYDSVFGGFGQAPKFPSPHNLYFLLRYWYAYKEDFALEMVEKTLQSMHSGGIFDHIGGGFSRYSTNRKWLVPHFEKMLYDNALISIAYLEAYQATKKQQYAEIAKRIFTYVLRDMTSPEGGFFSAEDADSEEVEGKFYIWTVDDVKNVLGERDGEWFCNYFDITETGNFEGYSIPNLIKNTSISTLPGNESDFLEKCRKKLFLAREERVHPYKDDKILTSWNGLMIAALAMAGRILDNDSLMISAEKASDFILTKLVREDGRLLARYRDGDAAITAYADDYTFMIWGLIELYEATYNPDYIQKAMNLNNDLIKYFWDTKNGGLFVYGNDTEQLITKPKEVYDGATPSSNSVAAMNFLRLARLTGSSNLEEMARQQFKTFGNSLEQIPTGHAFMLSALLYSNSAAREVVVVSGKDKKSAVEMLEEMKRSFQPFTVSLFSSEKHTTLKDVAPFTENYKTVDGKTTAYICENYSCQAPITNINEFKDMLN